MIKKTFQHIKELTIQTINKAVEDDIITQAAAIAFYTIFSLAPLFILVVAFGNLVLSQETVEAQVQEYLSGMLEPSTLENLTSYIKSQASEGTGILTSALAIVMIAFGATTVIGQIKLALNQIWNVSEVRMNSIWNFILNRLLSFGMIILFSLLLIFSLLAEAIFGLIAEFFIGLIPDLELAVYQITAQLGTIIFSVLFFMIIFKILPDVHAPWKDIFIGALVTSILFIIGKYLIGYYFSSTGLEATYRAAGSLVIFVIWLYYNILTILLGAVFTQVYTEKYGGKVLPYSYVSLENRPKKTI
ncbi:MAG: YihY/virulence factor BrkB family protein [Balneolaceae bacterium]|nr:YihY/virulence factor BrkB family protein [Balneolaceae bacterium]